MHRPETGDTPRLMVVNGSESLTAAAREWFAPLRIDAIPDYLTAIAELPLAPTRAVLVGVDPQCRQLEAAVAALRQAADGARIVFCCDPPHESVGHAAVQAGADDYIILPPREDDLERALQIPGARTRRDWLQQPSEAVEPAGAELEQLAALIAGLDRPTPLLLEQMAELVRTALGAEHVTVAVEGSAGTAPREPPRRGAGAALADAVLTDDLERQGKRIGQIRVGPRAGSPYGPEHTRKLRHYAVLLARLLEAAGRAAHWRELACRDELTGLGNRRYLMQVLDDLVERARRERSCVTVFMFDIDDFKRYNDQYGHAAGDEIIRETGQLFVDCCRKHDVICRYGGDEFVVVFWDAEPPRISGSHHPAEVYEILHRFRAALRTHRFSRLGPEAVGSLTITGGLASYPWQAHNVAELLELADKALLDGKNAGKNSFCLVGDGENTTLSPRG